MATMAQRKVETAAMARDAAAATAKLRHEPGSESFQLNDLVAYPAHGVGRVEKIGIENVAGHDLELIHVAFADNAMTLRIPVASAHKSGLRKLVSPEQMAKLLQTLTGRPRVSRAVWSRRLQDYQLRINSGDFKTLVEVVRDLQQSKEGSESSFSQRTLYEAGMERLAAEVSAVKQCDRAEARQMLESMLSG